MDYAVKSGIVAKLQAESSELKWETANNAATSVDLEGMGMSSSTECSVNIRDCARHRAAANSGLFAGERWILNSESGTGTSEAVLRGLAALFHPHSDSIQ
jgi:hypothetical protein